MATTTAWKIANLLEKMVSSDKDFRYMATNDLILELQKDNLKLDDDIERRIVQIVLQLLEDKNSEVQNLAVKCLGPLVHKVKDYHFDNIITSLCVNMLSKGEQIRDISSIGLKIVISELPLMSNSLAVRVCLHLIKQLESNNQNFSVQIEVLDILVDLLLRFGSLLGSFHKTIFQTLLPFLDSSRQAIRKRCIAALSQLTLYANTELIDELINFILKGISTSVNTYIQCITTMYRESGHKLTQYIDQIVPIIFEHVDTDDDEIREHCFQAFEIFIIRCPKEMTMYIPQITDLCLKYISHDPNYTYTRNAENEDDDDRMETDDSDGEQSEAYSDDDDISWKVRRSSAKCLETIISTRNEIFPEYYQILTPALIGRFKEREENVRFDIFSAYVSLLKQTKSKVLISANSDDRMDEELPIETLEGYVFSVIKALQNQIKDKSVLTRLNCFNLLQELVKVLPNSLSKYMFILISGIQHSLGDKNSNTNLKINTLMFLQSLLDGHPPEIFVPHMEVLVDLVITAIHNSFYKISADGLVVLQKLVIILRPLDKPTNFNFVPFVKPIYNCALEQLKANNIDQEVKEKAISCMGQVIFTFGDFLTEELVEDLPIFVDRLRNELTRVPTIKSLTKIVASPVKIDLHIVNQILPILGEFLHKNQRVLKVITLYFLNSLIQNYIHQMDIDILRNVIYEVRKLLDDSDIHIAQLCLTLLTSTVKGDPTVLENVFNAILPELIELLKSPLLQGSILDSMLELFQVLLSSDIPDMTYQNTVPLLISSVEDNVEKGLHRQTSHSVAKCIAAITAVHSSHELEIVQIFIQSLASSTNDTKQAFYLLAIGEIGKTADLSSIEELKNIVLAAFNNPSEKVKLAASYALGYIAVGNLAEYLPFVFHVFEAESKRQYLFLSSLKEIILYQSATEEGIKKLLPFVDDFWNVLLKHCECQEEGTRNLMAECLGKLTLIDPINLLPKLQEYLHSESSLMRSTVVTAVTYTISDQVQPIDPHLHKSIAQFLTTLEDSDYNVRRVALGVLNSAAHNKPSLINDLLPSVLPKLYNETKVRDELIRLVEMGPFKHTVDDGLDLRKAAFECMYTLLYSCWELLDIYEFLNHIEEGLKDHGDIKILNYLMLERLVQIYPNEVLLRLDRLIEPLRMTCMMTIQPNQVKQEQEKQEEIKRSAMRAICNLLNIADASKNPQMADFLVQLKTIANLKPIFDSVQKEISSLKECFIAD